jgi:hypothetical protein
MSAPSPRGLVASRLAYVAGALAWLGLASWRLGSVPGMSLDEAWSILSARGQWPPTNPLSGMTSYSGPFPVLLLRLLGTAQGIWILRGASVLANGACLVLVALMLRRAVPGRIPRLWSSALIASLPILLVVQRTGIEVVIFTPLAFVLGLYLFMQKPRVCTFAGGLVWGLLVYNHAIGICFPIAAGLAWWATYRRAPPFELRPAVLGAVAGLSPRLIAELVYHQPLEGGAARYSLLPALGDLRWVPLGLWRAWHGDAAYLRYVGRLVIEPWPYWLLGVVFVLPWAKRLGQLPRSALFTLLTALISALLVTFAAPYMAVRFFVLPVIGMTAFLAISGSAAIIEKPRWTGPIVGTAFVITFLNLFLCISDFYLPWHQQDLGYAKFFFGDRSKRTGNWHYYPKEALARELLALEPAPDQIITTSTLERPLRVLLDGSPIRVALPTNASAEARSIYVDYLNADRRDPHCVLIAGGERCFTAPTPIARYYVTYR